MKHLERICTGIDTSEIKAVLDRWPQLWTGKPLPGEGHKIQAGTLFAPAKGGQELFGIWLRWTVPPSGEFQPEISEIAYWARPLVQTLALVVGAHTIGWVSLHLLKAGCSIHPHIDKGGDRNVGRFHLVITSNPRCLVTSGGETAHMAPGELWWFDHQATHQVVNGGPDRVHLVFDAVTDTAFGWHRAEAAAA
jgi:Aspartyl/Asparaginyl beta-hydroxylase